MLPPASCVRLPVERDARTAAQEEGPEALSALENDVPLVAGGIPAWTPLVSSSSESVRNQVSLMVAAVKQPAGK